MDKKLIREVISSHFEPKEMARRQELWQNREKMERKILNVLSLEHSFLYGLCEAFTNNLDFVFRHLYQVFFMIAVSLQYSELMGDFTVMGICMLISLVIVITFISEVL